MTPKQFLKQKEQAFQQATNYVDLMQLNDVCHSRLLGAYNTMHSAYIELMKAEKIVKKTRKHISQG